MYTTTGCAKVQLLSRLFKCAANKFFANRSASIQLLGKSCDHKGQFYKQWSPRLMQLM